MKIKNKIKYLVLAAVLIFLVLPQPAFAGIGAVAFKAFDTALQGIEEATGPLMEWEFLITVVNIVALAFASFSAWALEYVTENTPQWLSVQHNPMVLSGWNFTVGLANLFIVLALIVIAFGFILKIESLEARKALPRLIIVALLVNFSLVFIGALVDITNILYNTILTAGGTGLPTKTFSMLGGSIADIITKFFVALIILAGLFMVPVAAPFAQFGKVLTIGIFFLPFVIQCLIQALFAFSVGGMFIMYAVLFAARVYMIQFLAIVSPIFFLCWALPPLKKYWDEWFGMLMEWLFFGVIFYFFLVLGLRAANFLMPPTLFVGGIPIIGLGLFLPWALSYYFFLFVYLMGVMYYVTSRLMPAMGKALIAGGTGMATTIAAASLPLLRGLRYEAGLAARKTQKAEKERYKEKQEELRAQEAPEEEIERYSWAKRHELTKEERKEVEKKGFFGKMGGAMVRFEETINRLQGTTIEEKERQEILSAKALAEKTKSSGRLEQLADDFEKRGLTTLSNVLLAEIFNRAQGMGHPSAESSWKKYEDDLPTRIQASLRSGDVDTQEILSRNMKLKNFYRTFGRLTNKEHREEAEEIYNKLTEEEIKKFNEDIKMPEETSDDEKKENLLRVIHHLRMTDVPEMGHWLPKSMKTVIPLIPHALNFEQRLTAIKQFRLPLARALSEDFDKKGLGYSVLNLPPEEFPTYSLYAAMYGGPSLKVADKPLQILQAQRQALEQDENKIKYAREFEKSLLSPEDKKVFGEFLRKYPERLHEIGSPDSAEMVREDLKNWKKGRKTAEVSPEAIEEEIKGLEEEKRKEEGKIEIGEAPDVKKIRELRERIRKLKRGPEEEDIEFPPPRKQPPPTSPPPLKPRTPPTPPSPTPAAARVEPEKKETIPTTPPKPEEKPKKEEPPHKETPKSKIIPVEKFKERFEKYESLDDVTEEDIRDLKNHILATIEEQKRHLDRLSKEKGGRYRYAGNMGRTVGEGKTDSVIYRSIAAKTRGDELSHEEFVAMNVQDYLKKYMDYDLSDSEWEKYFSSKRKL